MRKVRVRSMEDYDALPEGEWVEVVGRMKWDVPDPGIRVENGLLIVPLSRDVEAQLKPRSGEKLWARVSRSKLIVERKSESKAPGRRKKPAA